MLNETLEEEYNIPILNLDNDKLDKCNQEISENSHVVDSTLFDVNRLSNNDNDNKSQNLHNSHSTNQESKNTEDTEDLFDIKKELLEIKKNVAHTNTEIVALKQEISTLLKVHMLRSKSSSHQVNPFDDIHPNKIHELYKRRNTDSSIRYAANDKQPIKTKSRGSLSISIPKKTKPEQLKSEQLKHEQSKPV